MGTACFCSPSLLAGPLWGYVSGSPAENLRAPPQPNPSSLRPGKTSSPRHRNKPRPRSPASPWRRNTNRIPSISSRCPRSRPAGCRALRRTLSSVPRSRLRPPIPPRHRLLQRNRRRMAVGNRGWLKVAQRNQVAGGLLKSSSESSRTSKFLFRLAPHIIAPVANPTGSLPLRATRLKSRR